MNEYDYEPPRGQRRRQPDLDDNDFGREPRGRRDSDWADDLETRADGRLRQRRRENHNGYSNEGYEYMPEQPKSFRKRHPVLMNLIYIIAAGAMLLWMLMWFLDFWTFHGEERVVPDVKGQTFESAAGNVDISGLKAVISDSIFDSYSRPGTVVEQTPVPGAHIKKGGTVYLTVVAFTPKLITVPDFYNASARQARSMFEGLGIKDIREVPVTSEYEGLVLGAKFNGVDLQPGARIPISAIVTIEVGTGRDDTATTYDTDSVGAAIDNVIEELNIE